MNVDWAYFTPTFARFFRRYTIPSLKQLILGGEAVTVDDVRDWVGKVRVLNAYGPAESITWFLEPQEGRSSTISIGKPINMRAWIVSPEDPARLMPIGSIGELLLEGTSLFRGYIKNKEKTEQSLIASPIWHIQANLGGGLKMYKTGDLVRYLPDGTMTYIGRKDTMIKLYGQRMELEEVETMLRRNLPESVQSSADVVRPTGENEEPVLVAFLCVPEEFLGSSLQELKTHLQSKLTEALPAFMVPKIYIPVESMPYNSSRKLDRARLRQMVSSLTRNQLIELLQSKESSPQGKSQYLSPIEMALQKLWVDALLLDPKQVGPDNNFFALGGSSVTALKVTAAAKKEGIKLSYPDLFRAPTLRSLARVVSRSSNGTDITMPPFGLIEDTVKGTVISDAINQCQVPEDMIEDIYPLAPQQQGLWALSLIRGGDYIAQFILTLNPEVDVEKFCIAWETVVQLSPTLRTRFIESASGSYQVVLKGDINWQICSDLDDHLNGDIKTELAFGSPIVRHALISERERDVNTHKIIWTIHHALFDGESVPMFLNAVARAYDGVPPSPHIGPFNPFIKYVHSLDDRAASEYWRSQFDEIAPAAYPNLPELTYRPNPSCVYRKHIQFTRRLGSRITTATLLRAALALTMVKLTKNWDVTIGVTLAGRTAPVSNIESVIGPTFVTLPTRPFHGPNDNVQDYLDHTQSSITEMMPFEHTGMQKIATFSPQCDAASKFQTICLVQTPDDTSYTKLFNFDDTTGGVGRFNSHSLMVLLFTNPSGVDAVLSYDRAVIDDEEVFKLAYLFEGLIHVLCLEEDMRSITSILSFEPILEEFVNDPKLDAEQSLQGEIDQWPDTPPEMITDGLTASQPREMEILLAEAWVETLRLPENSSIGPKDEFVKTFGGTSLLSLKLAQCCREKGVHLTVKDIFLYPRLADMARAATEVFSEKNKTALVPPFSLIRPSENTILLRTEAATTCGILVNKVIDLYPCTPLQEGLLALSVTQPGSYISRTIYELVDHIDANRFCDSWNKLYQEEEILRTRLFQPKSASSAFQIVLSDTIEWQFPTNLALYMKEDEEVKMGFGTPLNRFALVRDTESSKRYFVLTIHHALYDGWSMPLLLDRVYETYSATGLTQARPSFNMFIQKITSSNPSDTSEYWKSQFQDADLVHFPPPLLLTEKPGKQVNLESSMSLSRTRHSGILTSTILRAAWALLLSTYTRSQDVIFGTTLSGRNVPLAGIERVVGPTMTTVPIRIQTHRTEQTGEFLRRVQDQSTQMIDYE
jgi:aryl carrier-like protein